MATKKELEERIAQLETGWDLTHTMEEERDAWQTRAEAAEALVADCAEYLKEGETPRQRMDRDHQDVLALMAMLAKDRAERDAMRARLAPIVALAEQIKATMKDATPGPWRIFMGDITVEGDDGDDRIVAGIGKSLGARSSVYSPIKAHKPEGKANALLICALRNEVAAILAAGGE